MFAPQIGRIDGYKHWQCRVSFETRRRLDCTIKFVKESLNSKSIHVERTISERGRDPRTPDYYLYCSDPLTLDPEGRVWSDKDRVVENTYIDGTWTPRPWQKQVLNFPNNDRIVYVIYDPVGNKGKSSLVRWIHLNNKGMYVPPMDSKGMLRCVYGRISLGSVPNIHMDLPRTYKSTGDLRDMYMAIEQIKSGYVYDDRYSWKDATFKAPLIVIYTNVLPNTDWLSYDRWSIWTFESGRSDECKIINRDLKELIDERNELIEKSDKTRK